MNLTLSVDDTLLERARIAAQAQGKSVNQLVREYLEQLSGQDNVDALLETFRQTSGKGHSKGWQFNRDSLHERT